MNAIKKCEDVFHQNNDLGETGLDKVSDIHDIDDIQKYSHVVNIDDLIEGDPDQILTDRYKWYDKKGERRGYIDVVTNHDISGDKDITGIFYVHGGGFTLYDPIIYRSLTFRLCKLINLPIFIPDYPLVNSPGNGDYKSIIKYLIQCLKYLYYKKSVTKFILMGDSSGGTCSIQIINYFIKDSLLKKKKKIDWIKLIDKIVLFSPWIDLNCNTPSYKSRQFCPLNRTGDPIFIDNAEKNKRDSIEAVKKYMNMPVQEINNYNPLLTPDNYFRYYPDTLIFVGDNETIRDDSILFSKKSQNLGYSNINVIVYNNMWHVWIQYSQGCGGNKKLIEAQDALQKTNIFIKNGYKFLKEKYLKKNMVNINIVYN